jgi:uncharacterized protein
MRILVDIGHPAHIHYFRNALQQLMKKGHEVRITTRDKEVTLELLNEYGFEYTCTGKNKKGVVNKLLTMVRNDIAIYKVARQFKPDIFFSFFSPFAAHVGWLMKKPVIGFTDSEFAKLSIRLTEPFTNYIFTPECFYTDFGAKHFRFPGYMESFYLQPKYFKPSKAVLSRLQLREDERYFIMRFVNFTAGHDMGEAGIDSISKMRIADILSRHGKLFISSEGPLDPRFEKYRLTINPKDFHHILAFADLYVGEGITTASECVMLGTPSVLINTLRPGYTVEQEKLGLNFNFDNARQAIPTIERIAQDPEYKSRQLYRRNQMLRSQVDCTGFLVWLLDHFPQSIMELERNNKKVQGLQSYQSLVAVV